MQKSLCFSLSALPILLALVSCSSSPQQKKQTSKSHQVNQIVDDYFEAYLHLYPLFATSIGDHRFDDQMTISITQAHHDQEVALVEKSLSEVKTLGCTGLDHQGELTCKTFVQDLSAQLDLLHLDIDPFMPFDQLDSFSSDYAELAAGSSYISFDNLKDYQNFLKRTEVLPAYLDTMIANMKLGMKKKITVPRVLIDRAIKQLHDLLPQDFKESVFYKPVINIDKVILEPNRETLKKQYEASIQNLIYPAYQRLEKFVKNEYRAHARKTHGVRALPNGDRYYLALAKINTTTDLSPDDIMKLGLSEVKRIRAEFEAVKTQFGFKGSLSDFFKSLRKPDTRFYPFHTPEEVLKAYQAIQQKLMAQIPQHFHLMPKAKFEIHEVEKFKAESASEAYQNPSADGTRPGIFWVPIPNPTHYASKAMESLFLHEAIPGHHFQISIQQELDLPRYRRFNGNNAYVEGWALYTESLGKELGLYTDPLQWIGRLENEMHRAIRLVVDPGIHWKGWSREKAIQYSLDNEPADLRGITSEIERYMAIPGQALSYKMGEIKLQELKKKAQRLQGAAFNEAAFHDEILKDGALPLSILDEKVTAWIHSDHP